MAKEAALIEQPAKIPDFVSSPAAWARVCAFCKDWKLPLLALIYVVAFLVFDRMVENINRYFIFCNLLIVSSLYFSWSLGGREAMLYVAFFNLFFAFVFARLFAVSNVISAQLFTGKSFMALYLVILIFMVIMMTKESPADKARRKRDEGINAERRTRQQLELMVATQKLTDDVIRQANRVKDELLLLQSSWKSQIHSIVNDLSPVKEKEIYETVVKPFQDDILRHLRGLEERLAFNPAPMSLDALGSWIRARLTEEHAAKLGRVKVTLDDAEWRDDSRPVVVDPGKTWEILLNLVRNSQTAIELRQIDLLRQPGEARKSFRSAIEVQLTASEVQAAILVRDTGGGLPPEQAANLFKRPVPSRKRGGKAFGQGTIFVKFFGESMGFSFAARNITLSENPGLEVAVALPLANPNLVREFTPLDQDAA